jgi:protein transport protein SEC24
MQASFSNSPYKNAEGSYQRCTMNAIPTTSSLLSKSKVPLALICTPYRSLKAGDVRCPRVLLPELTSKQDEVPVVSDCVIARCRRCRTYINPFVTFVEGGNRWKCSMCALANEVPQLFDWNQQANQPADRWARPELNHAVVDFVAPTEYMVRAPQPPVYVFLIDVSYPAIQSGTSWAVLLARFSRFMTYRHGGNGRADPP